ncbi:TPA: heparin lyase I family protein [Vibrio cholerae]|nr:heparin lyase I family protein [Vibrio cholerae]
MRVLTIVSIFYFFIFSMSSAFANKQVYYLDEVAKAINSEELREYMFLEAVPEETVFVKNGYIQFNIKEKQRKIFSGVRSELSINYPFKIGDRVSYSFDIMIPDDFISDNDNRWYILAQWHDQPNPNLGESWSNFPARSPIVYLYTEKLNGTFGIGVAYGKNRFWFPSDYNKWYTLSFDFLWSDAEVGVLKFTLNNTTQTTFHGKNMHNGYQHYLKIGMYRHPDIKVNNNVYFKELSIKHVD